MRGAVGATAASRAASGRRASEITSLDERMGLLFVVRMANVVLVMLAALFVSSEVGFDVKEIGTITAVYLALAVAGEGYRRAAKPATASLQRVLLPVDAVYLATVCTPAGGPRSQLVVLFAVQLIAVTLLASERAGIRMALWDSFLFILIPTMSLSGRIGSLLGVKVVAAPPDEETALAIVGFWVVAACTAFFASVSERELRRSKSEMAALAEMASVLEEVHDEAGILAVVLPSLVRGFGFRRGALWWAGGERPQGLVLDSGRERQPTRSVEVELGAVPDRLASEVWRSREALLVRRIDPEQNPSSSGLLPSARNVVVLALRVEGGPSGVILLEHGGPPMSAKVPRRTLLMLSQMAAHATLALRNARLLAERERLAAMDGLTGLANRREFDQVLAREVSRAARNREPLSLAVLDVDHFKAINDARGHLAGDDVLRAIADVLSEAVREMDIVARYGGEEFALVLPSCDQGGARMVLDRVRESMRRHPLLSGVTVSAGVASLPTNADDGVSLVGAADEALYRSKRAGRDRVTWSSRTGTREGVSASS